MTNSKPLSVLLVIDSLGSGGAQRQMVTLATGLAKRGHRVSLFIYYPEINHFRADVEGRGIEILEVRKKYQFDPGPCLALRKIIAIGSFDAILSFLNTPNVYAVLATLGNRRTKLVVSERKMFPDGRIKAGVWLRYQCYRFANAVTVNSFHQYERVLLKFPWTKPKLRAIWNGVDLERFVPGQTKNPNVKDVIRILAVATIVDWKNAFNLIKALHLVRQEGMQLQIDWAGRVLPQANSQLEFERCGELVQQLGLEEHWHWLGVLQDMHAVYPGYDALAHPSFVEGLPNVVCEALASGLPVLGGDVCDHALLIEEDSNGLLFNPGDPQSIADSLLKFCNLSHIERTRMGQRAREFAERELGVEKMIDSYEKLLYENE